MKYELFKFQKEAEKNCLGFLKNNNSKVGGLAVIPVAGGKSVIIAKLVKQIPNALVIVPSVELLVQNLKAMENEGLKVSVVCGTLGKKEIGDNYTIATIGSLKDLGAEFKKKKITNIIVDEAHHGFNVKSSTIKGGNELYLGMFKSFMKDVKHKKLLGLTATPFISGTINGKHAIRSMHKTRDSMFKELVHITQVSEVIKEKRWSKIVYDIHPVDKSSLDANTSGSEYSEESTALFIQQNNVNNRVCILLKKFQKQKTLTFIDTIDTAKKISDWYNSKGFFGRCEAISGDMPPKLRQSIIKEYLDTSTDLNHLINYGTLTTGFDFPELAVLIGARPTMSLSLYYQILGRLTRVHPNKKEGLYIDLVGNYGNFGAIEDFNFDSVGGFGMSFFSGDKLLTDVPTITPMTVTKDFLINPPNMVKIVNKDLKMWFGKFKGSDVAKLPSYYREFLLTTLVPPLTDMQQELKQLIEQLKENEFLRIFKK